MRVAGRRSGLIWQAATAAAVVAVAAVGAGVLAGGGAGAAVSGSSVRRPVLSAVRVGPGAQNGSARSLPLLTPRQIRAAYDLGPLYKEGITGKGQTIVIVDPFGSPTIARDLARFDKRFHLPAPPSLRVIQPAGKVPAYHASSPRMTCAVETSIDVEWAHVMAPGASIVVAETPAYENEGTTGFPQIVQAEKYVLRHKLGQVISQSFGATEQTLPRKSDYAALRNLRGAYKLADKDHVTVVAATGDQGVAGFEDNDRDMYSFPVVNWPASDPLVTAVGGTQLYLRADGARKSPDTGWGNLLPPDFLGSVLFGASGGGRSVVFGRPWYQDSVRDVTGSQRGVPDISMDAGSAVATYGSFFNPQVGRARWFAGGGTSLAAPMFAGVVALAYQYARQHHLHALGLINPAIYQMEARHEPGIVDIIKGNNSWLTVKGFSAGPGYDLVTGAGTVNAAYFVPELAELAG
jgi:subtilase family serine protease